MVLGLVYISVGVGVFFILGRLSLREDVIFIRLDVVVFRIVASRVLVNLDFIFLSRRSFVKSGRVGLDG